MLAISTYINLMVVLLLIDIIFGRLATLLAPGNTYNSKVNFKNIYLFYLVVLFCCNVGVWVQKSPATFGMGEIIAGHRGPVV